MTARELTTILSKEPFADVTLSVSDSEKQIFCEKIFEVTLQGGKFTIVADIDKGSNKVSKE